MMHHLRGIITDGDLRRALQRCQPSEYGTLKCESIMTRQPLQVTADTLAYDALRMMEDRPSQISVLPVVDGDERCIGLIRIHDIVRSGL
ncbi:MAG: CBS domain-containing protein [Pyrinomonadaceae bacterium]